MRIFWKIPTQFEYKNVGLTIGVFDGVHLGHQKIINEVVATCRKNGLTSLVITFEVHPRKILSSSIEGSITTISERINIISQMGMEACIVTDFKQEVMNYEATEFVEEVLIDKLKMRELWVGTNFFFGKGRKGDVKLLQELSTKKGFKLHIVEPVNFENEVISSTKIREYLKEGNVRKVNLFLSRPYSISAEVIRGVKRGRVLGYPTANLKWEKEILLPKEGVYAVKVKIDDEEYDGMANLGYQPTFGGKEEFRFEVHILDFEKEIYSKKLKVLFIDRIRDEKLFENRYALIEQLKEDEKKVRGILKL